MTSTVAVEGSGLAGGDWFRVGEAVVYFDHPQDAPVDHALCIDMRGEQMQRVSVELDAASARRLAEAILSTLADEEVVALTR